LFLAPPGLGLVQEADGDVGEVEDDLGFLVVGEILVVSAWGRKLSSDVRGRRWKWKRGIGHIGPMGHIAAGGAGGEGNVAADVAAEQGFIAKRGL